MTTDWLSESVPPGVNVTDAEMAALGAQDAVYNELLEMGERRAGLPKPYWEEPGITIYHGCAREILPLLPRSGLILTDPPYGVGKDYGELSSDTVENFVAAVRLVLEMGLPTAMFFPVTRIYDIPVKPQWMGVWEKDWGGSGLIAYPFYPHWEPIGFWNIKGDYRGNCGHRNDVFKFASVRPESNGHPTPKPLELVAELLSFMPCKGTVTDPYMGSGTTLLAAKQLRRPAVGIEIEERWCSLAVERLRQAVLPLEPAAPAPEQLELMP